MNEPAVAPEAPRNDLGADELRVRPAADGTLLVDPARAGWRYLSFEVRALLPGRTVPATTANGAAEAAIVVLAGPGVRLSDGPRAWTIGGRTSPFASLPGAFYTPDARGLVLEAIGGPVSVAIASAPRSSRDGVAREPIVVTPADVSVEIRGAGNATRQINHIIAPGFPADRLEVVEVLTPSGNWSSWPPHKHDVDAMPGEAVLEEIYCYQFRRPEAWGLQRLYRRDGTPAHRASGPRDASWAVRQGEVVLVTDGYHPFVAAHGDDAYYLNALAGDRRTMACSFDPDLDWVRESWTTMAPDPRLPLVG